MSRATTKDVRRQDIARAIDVQAQIADVMYFKTSGGGSAAMLHGDVDGRRHAISRTICSSSASIQEAPARDGECRRTSPAIDSFFLRFVAPGVRPTLGGPPTTAIASNESGAVAETETSCSSKPGRNYQYFSGTSPAI